MMPVLQMVVCGLLLIGMAWGNFVNTVATLTAKAEMKAKMKRKGKQMLHQMTSTKKADWEQRIRSLYVKSADCNCVIEFCFVLILTFKIRVSSSIIIRPPQTTTASNDVSSQLPPPLISSHVSSGREIVIIKKGLLCTILQLYHESYGLAHNWKWYPGISWGESHIVQNSNWA